MEKTDTRSPFVSSFCGLAQGICSRALVHPIEVVKYKQQESAVRAQTAACVVFQKGGVKGFYRGLFPEIIKTGQKQLWCWPLMTEVPVVLDSFGFGKLSQQAMTGFCIATVDSLIATPLEKAKIQSALLGKRVSIFQSNGWQGLHTNWAKSSVAWSSFLLGQKVLRDFFRGEDRLFLSQAVAVGFLNALFVSVVTAPFDCANTLKQANNTNLKAYVHQHGFKRLYRGSFMQSLTLVIKNIASIFALEKLGQ